MPIEIRTWEFRNVTQDEAAALNTCSNQMRAERLPDDPPIPAEETLQGLKNFPDHIQMDLWTAWSTEAKEIVGYGMAQYSLEDNLHMAQFAINVLPEFRRQGLGREFLSRIAQVAKEQNRRLLITDTTDRIPAGEAFMQRIEAERGLEAHTNQLAIADLDRNLVHQWRESARERGAGFEIGLWEGRYPDEYIDAIVELHDLLNQQPFGDLDIEDFTYSADQLRQTEKTIFARGYERWTLFVQEIETGQVRRVHRSALESEPAGDHHSGHDRCIPRVQKQGLGALAEGRDAGPGPHKTTSGQVRAYRTMQTRMRP